MTEDIIQAIMQTVASKVSAILNSLDGPFELLGLAAMQGIINVRLNMLGDDERDIFDKIMKNTTTIAMPVPANDKEDDDV